MTNAMNYQLATKGHAEKAPSWWKRPCAHNECTLHQLSPYIGKIKSTIAGELIERYSKKGDLIVDPFAGASTIPLEAVIRGRRTLAADCSPYSHILSRAKLNPPRNLPFAISHAEAVLFEALSLPSPDLRSVPLWVRQFFHPKTLSEALRFATVARRPGNEFLMACLLGILHHQRPGFLSYPSSHLVPYLRAKKYPQKKYPAMYEYRELRPRLLAKVVRSYRRVSLSPNRQNASILSAVEQLKMPRRIDALITSPPYMNALDYGRDNRLRLWFIDPSLAKSGDRDIAQRCKAFTDALTSLAIKLQRSLKRGGYAVFVVGEEVHRSYNAHPSEIVNDIITKTSPSLRLRNIIVDSIPDIRRTRRECRGVKKEHFLVFQKA